MTDLPSFTLCFDPKRYHIHNLAMMTAPGLWFCRLSRTESARVWFGTASGKASPQAALQAAILEADAARERDLTMSRPERVTLALKHDVSFLMELFDE